MQTNQVNYANIFGMQVLSIISAMPQNELSDRLNNVLTGIALKSGILQARIANEPLKTDLAELEDLAVEAVRLLRELELAPTP